MEEKIRSFDSSRSNGEKEQRIAAVGRDIIHKVADAIFEHQDAKRITDDEVSEVIDFIVQDLARTIGKTLPQSVAEPSQLSMQQIELAAGVYVEIPKKE